jgi:myo-inositol-1-phosphate synthase
MSPIRVAIVGVGNCASSLVQGVHYYRDADPAAACRG